MALLDAYRSGPEGSDLCSLRSISGRKDFDYGTLPHTRPQPPPHTTPSHYLILDIMARIARVGGAVLLATAASLLLAFHFLLNSNQELFSLAGLPSAGDTQQVIAAINATTCNAPLSTQGRYIVDANKQRFKLISVNWYGASDELFVVGGLNLRHRLDIAMTIKRLGFNSVRLPYSDELVMKNPVVHEELVAANVDLKGLHALDVYAAVVNALTEVGLAVIINDHITQARWCCDANLCDGQWSNDYLGALCPVRQTKEDWIRNLETVMTPHMDNPLVVGADLRNEIRGVKDRLIWNSWASAAEEAAERLHLLQPDWLIVVEGVSSANIVTGARRRPVQLSHPNKLVYSAHVYGWSGWSTLRPYWGRPYKSFAHDMQKHWAFLLDEDVAPVWIGEFGAPAQPKKGDAHYWQNLMRYLQEKDADLGYWAINPRKPNRNREETYGLLEDDWVTPRYDYRLHDIARLAQTGKGLS